MEKPPPQWGEDQLTEFFDVVRNNQFATFANKESEFKLISKVDASFQKICENLSNPSKVLEPFLLLRCHSTYRAACSAIAGGQVTECFVLLRSALEYSGYALLLGSDAELQEAWLRRHETDETEKAFRRLFTHGRTVDAGDGVPLDAGL